MASGCSIRLSRGFLAVAEWLRGRLAAAERAFASSISGWDAVGQLTTWVWGQYSVAALQRAQGRLDASDRTCRDALQSLDSTEEIRNRPPVPPWSGWLNRPISATRSTKP